MQAKEDFPFCLDISPNINTAPALKYTGAGDTGNTDNNIIMTLITMHKHNIYRTMIKMMMVAIIIVTTMVVVVMVIVTAMVNMAMLLEMMMMMTMTDGDDCEDKDDCDDDH